MAMTFLSLGVPPLPSTLSDVPNLSPLIMADVLSDQVISQDVEEVSPRIQVLHFAVGLPPTALRGFDEPAPRVPVHAGDVGVVGTITLLNKSAMIWFGWGRLQNNNSEKTVARGIPPTMGPVVVAMPRTDYKGAFSDAHESSSSQLIGGGEEDQIIGGQMASRLSQSLGFPIIVSCSLSSSEGAAQIETLFSGLDRTSVAQRAAALAEKEVARLLTEHKVP